jgi:membrane-associated phospholipid phosphatase
MDWLLNLDREVYRAIHVDIRREWLDPVFVLITQTGLGHVQFAALIVACMPHGRRLLIPATVLAVLVLGLLIPDFRPRVQYQLFVHGIGLALLFMGALAFIRLDFRRYALPALFSGILSGVVRLLVMRLMDRSRPSNLNFADPIEQTFGNTSFPSGHATTSFAIAFSFYLLTRKTDASWIGRWAIAWAILVGISRIYIGVHWPTDILAAAGLGLASAAFVHLMMKQDPPEVREALGEGGEGG